MYDLKELNRYIKDILVLHYGGRIKKDGEINFHSILNPEDDTPSAFYNLEKGGYKDFSTGDNGGTIKLAKHLEKEGHIKLSDFKQKTNEKTYNKNEFFLTKVKEHYKTRNLNLPGDWYLNETKINGLDKLSLIITTYIKNEISQYQRILYKYNLDVYKKKDFFRLNFSGNLQNYIYIPEEWNTYKEHTLIICEGVPDTLTYTQNGFKAIGLRSKDIIKNKKAKKQLLQFIEYIKPEQIIIIPDRDALELWKKQFLKIFESFIFVNLNKINEKIYIKDANDFLCEYCQGNKEEFKQKLMELINNSEEISVKTEYEELKIDELYEKIIKGFYYDIIQENVIYLDTQKSYTKDDFKQIIKERLRLSGITEGIGTLRNQIYVRFITDKERFIYGDFTLEHGLNNLFEHKSDDEEEIKQVMEVKNKKLIVDTEKFPPFEMPKYKDKDFSVWTDLLNLFEEDCQEIAYYSLQLFIKNMKLSYYGKERLQPIFIILYGVQNIGKDKLLFRFLTSFIPKEYIKPGKAAVMTDQREFAILKNAFVLHFSDMQGFEKSEVQKIKEFITSDKLTYRILGQNAHQNVKNCANYIGTTNEEFQNMYKDITGERRFIELRLKKSLKSEDVYNTLKKYDFDATCLYETVNMNTDYKAEFEKIRKYQEEEMRYKPAEEEFIIESLQSNMIDKLDSENDEFGNIKYICEKEGHINSTDLYKMYLVYCRQNYFKDKEIYNKRYFGRRIRPVMERYGFTYVKSHRYYKLTD